MPHSIWEKVENEEKAVQTPGKHRSFRMNKGWVASGPFTRKRQIKSSLEPDKREGAGGKLRNGEPEHQGIFARKQS